MTLRELAEADLQHICNGEDGTTFQVLDVRPNLPANQLIGAAEIGRVRLEICAPNVSILKATMQRVTQRCEIPEGCEMTQPCYGPRGFTSRITVEYG